MTTPKPRFRPRLDRLEARECPAVTITRVGAVLTLTGDAADDWVAVCDEGFQTVEVQTERGTENFRDIRRIVGNLGQGDDAFEFHQAATNPSNSLVARVDLAAGDDRFEYRSPPPEPDQPPPERDRPARYLLNVHTGFGDDAMVVGPEYIPGLGVEVRADLSDGRDGFEFLQGERPTESLKVAVDLGGDDDQIQLLPPLTGVASPYPLNSVLPAKWSLAIRAGFGNDVAVIQPCVVPGLDLSVLANLGDGDDALDAAFTCPAVRAGTIIPGIGLTVDAGEGNDTVEVAVGNPNELEPLRVADVHVGIRGFGGDDSGIIIICDVAVTGRLTAALDLGAGDDSGMVELSNPNEFLGPVRLRMDLGDGDDDGTYFCDGKSHAAGAMSMTMNTGAGDDWASVMIQDSEDFQAFEGPVALRMVLGDGDDLANVVVRDANDTGGPFCVAVAGGTGDDGIIADVDFTPRIRAGQLDPGNAPASVLVALGGGDGLDAIDAYTEGAWNGLARFLIRGGAEADDLGFHGVIGTGSTGALAVAMGGATGDDVLAAELLIPVEQVVPISMRLLAGAGADVLAVNLLGGPDTTPEPHLFVLDGGDGLDLVRAPAGAVVRNCEGRA